MVVLPPTDRRSRPHHEERGEAEQENELDIHIEDVLRLAPCDPTVFLLLMDAVANEIDSNER